MVKRFHKAPTVEGPDLVFKDGDGNWVAIEIKALNRAADKVNKTKDSAQQFLYRHGFVTKNGKLKRAYKA